MKPNFALHVTDDALSLLHRTRAGWTRLGGTSFDRDDLDQALGVLRDQAVALAPKGVTTKIIIPNSQILYMDLPAPGPSDTARRAQITRGLDGRTPYAVTDLVFDWSGEGEVVQVAVLARETLEQAEGFLAPHGFNAVSFVAIPPEGAFAGEPWFGPTAGAAGILGKGKSVTRDAEPVLIAVVAQEDVPETGPETGPETRLETTLETGPESDLAPELDIADFGVEDSSGVVAAAVVADTSAPEPFQAAAGFVDTPPDPAPVAAMADDTPEEAPFTHVADAGIADAPPPPLPPEDDDLPPAPSQAALVAFASRRGGSGTVTAEPTVPPSGTPMPGLVAERLAARAQALAEAGGAARTPPRIDAAGRSAGGGAFVTAPSIAGAGLQAAKKRKATGPAAPVAATAVNDLPARKPLTKPGGTFAASDAARGKPRYLGLILTGILLLLLALVAAWSSFFLASQNAPAPATEVAATEVPAVDDEMLADAQDPADFAAPVVAAAPVAETVPVVEPAPATEPAVASGPAPETGVDATLPLATNPETAQDEIVLSALDAPPATVGATALALPTAQPDALPAAQMPPPPFGTVYQFDAAGLIIPTPEGIITPEGVRVVAGPPARVPPARPAAIAAAAAAIAVATPVEPAAPAATDPPVTDSAATFAADPALANARPRVRPEGLVPAGAVPGADDAALAPDTPTRTTSLIPRARPAAIVTAALAAGEEARQATESASLAASAAASDASEAAVLALVAPDPTVSPLAVSVSRVPAPRPRDLEKAVAAAVAAASRPAPDPEPEPEPVVERQAAIEPEAEEEPEVAEAAPSRPTGRTVAEQATFVNAIALNRINLIGVYGTQSNRYALIRQANGRYKKVSVGDRIDGGVVAAITNDEVRYQKGGRMIALEMPRG